MARYVVSPDFSDWFRRDRSVSVSATSLASPTERLSELPKLFDDVVMEGAIEKLTAFLKRISHDPVGDRLPLRSLSSKGQAPHRIQPMINLGDTVVSFDAEPGEVTAKRGEFEGILLEKAKPRWIEGLPPSGFIGIHSSSRFVPSSPLSGYSKRTIEVMIFGRDGVLTGVDVHAYWKSIRDISYIHARTGSDGRIVLEVPVGLTVTMEVVPQADHWSLEVEVPPDQSELTLTCAPIDLALKGLWWREQLIGSGSPQLRGAGIRVGIVDSGVGPHPALAHVREGGAFGAGVDEAYPLAQDLRGHGTHVAGIIGARKSGTVEWEGLAPDAEILSYRVFGQHGSTDQSYVADAILDLAQQEAHLVNLSLSSREPSSIERQAVRMARDLGTLCIAAAGNHGREVQYPAAYSEVVAVGAVGLEGEWLPGTPSAKRAPVISEDWGNSGLFGANFSNRGRQVACVAPGVAVASTVANVVHGVVGHAVMDGTSMASPMVTGALAAVLSGDEAYVGMAPTRKRSLRARRNLKKFLAETGLASENWGDGIPDLTNT